jgi:hypothetical protein
VHWRQRSMMLNWGTWLKLDQDREFGLSKNRIVCISF